MIQHGAEKVFEKSEGMGVFGKQERVDRDDFDEILRKGEERTEEMKPNTRSSDWTTCRSLVASGRHLRVERREISNGAQEGDWPQLDQPIEA